MVDRGCTVMRRLVHVLALLAVSGVLGLGLGCQLARGLPL